MHQALLRLQSPFRDFISLYARPSSRSSKRPILLLLPMGGVGVRVLQASSSLPDDDMGQPSCLIKNSWNAKAVGGPVYAYLAIFTNWRFFKMLHSLNSIG